MRDELLNGEDFGTLLRGSSDTNSGPGCRPAIPTPTGPNRLERRVPTTMEMDRTVGAGHQGVYKNFGIGSEERAARHAAPCSPMSPVLVDGLLDLAKHQK